MPDFKFQRFRRPHLAAIGWGINSTTVLHQISMLVSGEYSRLPIVVRAAPVFGFALAATFFFLALRVQSMTQEVPE